MSWLPKDEIAGRVRDAIQARKLTQHTLARAAKVGQPQVSRIVTGDFDRVTPNVMRVCEYLGIDLRVTSANSRLHEAVCALWDGTAAGERALCDLLNSVAKLGAKSSRVRDR